MSNTPTPLAVIVGYARVSTKSQILDRQLDTLTRFDTVKVFTDKTSGRTMARPGWEACREYLRPGDTLVVDALDRLGRSTLEVVETINDVTKFGVIIQAKKEGKLDPSTATGKLMIQMFAALAEWEVDLKAERAAAAREAAAARGLHTGRPRKLDTADAKRARELRYQGLSATEVGKSLGVSRATVYRYLAD